MWAIRNDTAYAADRTWVRDKDGRHHWIVVAKATFEFSPDGALRLADEQLAPLHAPEYFGEAGKSSLRYEADLVAHKPGTDVIAPADQRPRERLRGGERIGLINLTREGLCVIELPRVALFATTRVFRRTSEQPLDLSTVALEPEERRLIMVWQGSVCVDSRDVEYLDESRIRERRRG